MDKYLLVVKNTWTEITTYRLNFVMWRVRNVLQLLTIYALWTALSQDKTIFGYTQVSILTYILATSIIGSVVLSSRTQEIGENINNGDLSIFLIKPWGYFRYWFFRDIGDKAMNTVFSFFEIGLLIVLFSPPIFLQTNPVYLIFFITSVLMALLLNFFFGALLGLIGFWSPEIWGPRFLSYILISFLSGQSFPLDIFPSFISTILMSLPFSYFLYFPVKIYLGQFNNSQILFGFLIGCIWILIFYFLNNFIWKIGLRKFEAVGR